MKRDALDWDLLDRYFAKELDETSAAAARRSLIGHEREMLVLQAIHHELDGGTSIGSLEHEDAKRSWSQIQTRNRELGARSAQSILMRTHPFRSWTNWRTLALSLAVVLCVTTLFMGGWQKFRSYGAGPLSARQVTTYTTPEGQQSHIILPDGSTVLLNVASRLDVPTDFAQGNRRVTLSGAALFSVQSDAKKPFLVDIGRTKVRVLGTTFVVRSYETDTATTVAVRTGRVSVGPVVVSAAQQVTVTRSGATLLDVTNQTPFAFEKGVLMLDGIPLERAVADLNRWYNVDLRIADPVLARSVIRATLPAGSVADLKTMLEFMFDAVAVQDNAVLTLYRR